MAESEDVRRQLDSGGLRYAVLLLLYGDVSIFLLLGRIGPPPTLRPKNIRWYFVTKQFVKLNFTSRFP
jgi:hypothetical protein